jgi:hypothetical protein
MKFRVSNSVNSFRFKGRRYRSGETIELPESIAVNFSHVLDAVEAEVEPVKEGVESEVAEPAVSEVSVEVVPQVGENPIVHSLEPEVVYSPKPKRFRGKRVKEM